ncbi:MAG: pyridoxamine 5'-phosphate oxidase family protein [Chloroflexi bacterium]|nr:pyridoxamine 5'-phosphate oxidase family protein [Chloroflexota bacterium]MBI3761608.1 pyridoxamine 5'-phosphate oxidase family protein [Chloroflexota bacterium]
MLALWRHRIAPLMDELRDTVANYLLKHQVCVLSTSGTAGAWAMPTWYRSRGLEVECLVPRWADVAYYLEQNPEVLLVIHDPQAASLRWLQYRGVARLIDSPDWSSLLPERMSIVRPEERYVTFRIKPERIDLIDESRGWGARETLDF